MMKVAYGEKSARTDVPKPASARIDGGAAVITFAETGSGLKVKGDRLKDFAILVDGKYQWADARIVGSNQVAVTLPEGVTATTVRYGWDDYPQPSLYNNEGVPVPQFQIEVK